MEGTKFEILTEKIADNKADSFWYKGKDIARVQFPNGKKLYAEASGDISLSFEVDGDCFDGLKAIEEAERRNITDAELNTFGTQDLWRNNNWFHVILVDIDGEVISDDLGIAGNYDDAIKLLKSLVPETYEKMYKTFGKSK